MDNGGLLFSILPCSAMVKGGSYKKWRKNALKSNMLLSVVTFVEDLFYPQSQPPPLGIIFKKGVPHPEGQSVLWIKIWNDGYRKVKGKRIKSAKIPDELDTVKTLVQSFLINPTIAVQNIQESQKACPIEFNIHTDPEFEIVPEAYLDAKPPTTTELQDGMQRTIREHLAFLIRTNRFSGKISDIYAATPVQHNTVFQEVAVKTLFNPLKGAYHASSELDSGAVPLISCSTENMGIEGYFDIKEELHSHCLTVASDGTPLATFYQPYTFAAKDNVIILKPKEKLKPSTILFVALQLNKLRWRFSYGRKCYSTKFRKTKIFLPSKDEKIDEEYIEDLCNHCYGWTELKEIMEQ